MVKLIEGRALITALALCRNTESLGDRERILDRLRIERVTPRWPRNGEDRAKVAEVILPCGGTGRDGLDEADHVGACDLAASQFGDVIAFDRPQHLSLGAADLALRFVSVTVDYVAEFRIVTRLPRPLDCSGFAQFGFPACHPGVCRLPTIKGLGFAVYDLAASLNDDLGRISPVEPFLRLRGTMWPIVPSYIPVASPTL